MNAKDADAMVWIDSHQKRRIVLHIGMSQSHSTTAYFSPAAAERLAKALLEQVAKLPRVAEASDLGLEAA